MYYPLLKNSHNEMKALRELHQETRELVVPIIESKRIKKENVHNWTGTFNTLGRYLAERLVGMKFIYDFYCSIEDLDSEDELITSNGFNLVNHCISKMKEADLDLVPCFQHDSPEWLIQSVLNSGYKEIAVRIRCHDFKESFDPYVLEKLRKDIAIIPDIEITVILDFYNQDISLQRIQHAIDIFSEIPNSKIVYLSTSCPEDASNADVHAITLVEARKDLDSYLQLKGDNQSLLFGDYTTRLQGEVLSGFNHNNSYLKIFYTSETDYYIAKSRLIKDNGEETFYQICSELIEQDYYSGNEFSYGDGEIYKCAKEIITISGHQQPIAIAVNHHIELTVSQLC